MGLKLAFDYPPDLGLTGAVQLGSHTLSLYSQISYPVTGRAYPLVSISSPPPPPSVTFPRPITLCHCTVPVFFQTLA